MQLANESIRCGNRLMAFNCHSLILNEDSSQGLIRLSKINLSIYNKKALRDGTFYIFLSKSM